MLPQSDPNLWYLAYCNHLANDDARSQPGANTIHHRRPRSRWLVRWCGHAALRMATWLLADELPIRGAAADGSAHPPLASRW